MRRKVVDPGALARQSWSLNQTGDVRNTPRAIQVELEPSRIVRGQRRAWLRLAGSRSYCFQLPGCIAFIVPVVWPSIPFMRYLPRIVDEEIQDRLRSSGAVLLDGPKASGKTATARRHARSEHLLDADPGAAQMMQVDPRLLLQGNPPTSSTSGRSTPISGTTCVGRSMSEEFLASSS